MRQIIANNCNDMTKFIRKLFIPIVRSAFLTDSNQVKLTDDDYDQLMRLGKKQSILPIIWKGLKHQSIHEEKLKTFDIALMEDIRDYVHKDHFYSRICEALRRAEIPFIPLKGSVIKDLYPEPWMRTSSDIDILVNEYDLENAIVAIENSTDFRMGGRGFHDVSMANQSVHLELHFSIIENMPNIDRVLLRVWDYTEKTGEEYRFTPEFQIFHVVAHMSYHLRRGGLGIRPFLDLWLLRTKTDFDEQRLQQLLEEAGILTFYKKSCAMLDIWMNSKPYTPELEALEEYCFTGGVYGNIEIASAAFARNGKGLRYLIKRLFISRTALEGLYPRLKRHPFLLPYYQVKRWLRLKDTSRRKRIVDELNGVRMIKREKIDSFDKLLVSLGL